ncbi:MAG: hypothetical protein ACP5JP_09915 [bacterium]
MRSNIKHSFLWVFIYLIMAIWMTGCPASSHLNEGPRYCGPHSIVFSSTGTAYLLGWNQILAIDPQGNLIYSKQGHSTYGTFSDMLDISDNGHIWEVSSGVGGIPTILISTSEGNFVTQIATDFLTSVKVSPSTDIGWVGGLSSTSNTILEALNVSGQTLTSFTLPENLTSYRGWIFNAVKLAISRVDSTVWAWSRGYLSGYLFTGPVYGPYPINLFEPPAGYLNCATNEKWIIVDPITNAIWMGTPATTTILALSKDGTIQFQKDLDIYVSTMAVSPKTGNVWIGSKNKIEMLDPYGNVIKQLTFKNLRCITYIAISPLDNTVWVGNETNMASTDKNIFILDENGNIINSFHVPVACLLPAM